MIKIKNNCPYMPAKKRHVLVWVANKKALQMTESGLYKGDDQYVRNEMQKIREGIIINMTSGCFEEDFDIKFKVGDVISFRGYSGELYEKDDDFFRIFEDKYVMAKVGE